MPIRLGLKDGIAVITIDRPGRLDAMDAEHDAGLSEASRRVRDHPGMRVATVTGAGTAPSPSARRDRDGVAADRRRDRRRHRAAFRPRQTRGAEADLREAAGASAVSGRTRRVRCRWRRSSRCAAVTWTLPPASGSNSASIAACRSPRTPWTARVPSPGSARPRSADGDAWAAARPSLRCRRGPSPADRQRARLPRPAHAPPRRCRRRRAAFREAPLRKRGHHAQPQGGARQGAAVRGRGARAATSATVRVGGAATTRTRAHRLLENGRVVVPESGRHFPFTAVAATLASATVRRRRVPVRQDRWRRRWRSFRQWRGGAESSPEGSGAGSGRCAPLGGR